MKVLWRHPETEHEADGLRVWDGRGAVRLHAAAEVDAETTALLLERCRPGTALRARLEPEQDLVVAGLLRDSGLVREGIALFRQLPDTAERDVLLCTDLHADNVLAAEREPWLVIDPKPYVGDPNYQGERC
ncbi:MAG: aminoglycoside phosphotransferase family protein [Acidimicrobiales bacterium]